MRAHDLSAPDDYDYDDDDDDDDGDGDDDWQGRVDGSVETE